MADEPARSKTHQPDVEAQTKKQLAELEEWVKPSIQKLGNQASQGIDKCISIFEICQLREDALLDTAQAAERYQDLELLLKVEKEKEELYHVYQETEELRDAMEIVMWNCNELKVGLEGHLKEMRLRLVSDPTTARPAPGTNSDANGP
ncbi:hypothetical protein AJ78_03532 [Emergomyces pasteurianus Ep9510]|uniref:Uncharacterized protein n=1 Tax=Emergomyces pasteurianus Ep9510 TaxID=1447872 RepID=A0A1J9PIK1_9EURO|nr:hypothetical protein AJ78_03532 [Emergomyces pasteurianus Ep9510]